MCGAHTWLESLLPYIEQQALYDQLDFNLPIYVDPNSGLLIDLVISNLICPSDITAARLDHDRLCSDDCQYGPGPAGTHSMGQSYTPSGGPISPDDCVVPPWPNFGNCQSQCQGCWYTNPAKHPGMFVGGPTAYEINDCEDGTSNTFLLGEQIPGYAGHHLYFNSHRNVGTTNIPPNYHKINPRNCPDPVPCGGSPSGCFNDMVGFKSRHPGGLLMALTDGSVRFVGETIDYTT